MNSYFRLQYSMLCRKMAEFGLPPLIGGVLGVVFFLAVSFYLFFKTEFAPYILIVICLSFLTKLGDPHRNEFLKFCFSKKEYLQVRLVENAIMGLPFMLFLLYKEAWLAVGLLLLLIIVMAFSSFSTSISKSMPTPFSRRPYEFAQGFRQSYLVVLAAYMVAVAAIPVHNVNLGIFTILLVFMVGISYYMQPEPSYYVWIFNRSPKQFLAMKLWEAVVHSTILVLPILAVLLLFFIQYWHLILGFTAIGYGYLCLMVLAKYAAYPEEMSVPQGIMFMLCFVLPPLILLVAPFFYKKAIQQLNNQLQ